MVTSLVLYADIVSTSWREMNSKLQSAPAMYDYPSYRVIRSGILRPSSPTILGLGSNPSAFSTFISGPFLISNTKFFTSTHNTVYEVE